MRDILNDENFMKIYNSFNAGEIDKDKLSYKELFIIDMLMNEELRLTTDALYAAGYEESEEGESEYRKVTDPLKNDYLRTYGYVSSGIMTPEDLSTHELIAAVNIAKAERDTIAELLDIKPRNYDVIGPLSAKDEKALQIAAMMTKGGMSIETIDSLDLILAVYFLRRELESIFKSINNLLYQTKPESVMSYAIKSDKSFKMVNGSGKVCEFKIASFIRHYDESFIVVYRPEMGIHKFYVLKISYSDNGNVRYIMPNRYEKAVIVSIYKKQKGEMNCGSKS